MVFQLLDRKIRVKLKLFGYCFMKMTVLVLIWTFVYSLAQNCGRKSYLHTTTKSLGGGKRGCFFLIGCVCAHYDHKSTDTHLTVVCGFPRKNEVCKKGKYRKMPF